MDKPTPGEVLYNLWRTKHPAVEADPLSDIETWNQLDFADQGAWEGLASLVGRGLLSYAILGAALHP